MDPNISSSDYIKSFRDRLLFNLNQKVSFLDKIIFNLDQKVSFPDKIVSYLNQKVSFLYKIVSNLNQKIFIRDENLSKYNVSCPKTGFLMKIRVFDTWIESGDRF